MASLYAKALYSNHAECEEELDFCKGDMLGVIEKDIPDMPGWCLCLSSDGRQGIAPANRLQIIKQDEEEPSESNSSEDYDVPRHSKLDATRYSDLSNRSSFDSSNGGSNPPSNRSSFEQGCSDTYDVPCNQARPVSISKLPYSTQQSVVKARLLHWHQRQLAPINNAHLKTEGDYSVPKQCENSDESKSLDRSSHSFHSIPNVPKRTSLEKPQLFNRPNCIQTLNGPSNHGKVPRWPPAPCGATEKQTTLPVMLHHKPPHSSSSNDIVPSLHIRDKCQEMSNGTSDTYDSPRSCRNIYDVPSDLALEETNSPVPRSGEAKSSAHTVSEICGQVSRLKLGLPLTPAAGGDGLRRLAGDLRAAVNRLTPVARSSLESAAGGAGGGEVSLACLAVCSALGDWLSFTAASLNNLAPSSAVSEQVQCEVRPVEALQSSLHSILERVDAGESVQSELARFVSCADCVSGLVDTATKTMCEKLFLIFPRRSSQNTPPKHDASSAASCSDNGDNNSREWLADYDYVPEKAAGCHSPDTEPPSAAPADGLSTDDGQLLKFYAAQLGGSVALLTRAVDGLLASMEQADPPQAFVAHSKFVVLTAHKLINVGDTLRANVASQAVRARVRAAGDAICADIKVMVARTKDALRSYPSPQHVHTMLACVTGLARSARAFQLMVTRAAEQVAPPGSGR